MAARKKAKPSARERTRAVPPAPPAASAPAVRESERAPIVFELAPGRFRVEVSNDTFRVGSKFLASFVSAEHVAVVLDGGAKVHVPIEALSPLDERAVAIVELAAGLRALAFAEAHGLLGKGRHEAVAHEWWTARDV